MKKIHVRQHDATDCAAACLASISIYYGREITISKLRDVCGTDIKGTSVNGLIDGAKTLGFDAKAVRVGQEAILKEKMTMPLIAHVIKESGMSHFIVVYKIKKEKLYISDPASDEKIISVEDFFKIYDGIIVLLKPNDNFVGGKVKQVNVFSKYLKLLTPHKRLFITAIISSLLLTIIGIVSNFFNQILIDEILPYNLRNQLTVFAIGFLVISLISIVLGAIRTHILLYLSQKIDIPLTMGYYSHIFSLPMKFFGTRKAGDILTRFQDAQTVKNVLSGIALSVLIDVTMVSIVGVVLYFMNAKLFVIVLIATLINIALVYIFKKPYKSINLIQMEQGAKLNSTMIESLRGIETIKANALEEMRLEQIENNYIDVVKTSFKEGVLSNTQQTVSSFIGTVINITMLWIGAIAVMNSDITLGSLMTFTAMAGFFMDPVGRLVGLQLQIQESQIAMKRLSEIYDTEVEQVENKLTIEKLTGDIEFKNITFRYGSRNPVLNDISLTIKEGNKVAIVGESGSGKTTLAKLILGLWDFEAGDLQIGNNAVRDIHFQMLRNKVAYVNQNIELFSGSISENIKTVNSNVSVDQIRNALRLANCDFVNNLPNGIETYLEEAGANLSGGERQRLAIARSLIKDFDILIFDEATSNLDFVSEQKIYKSLFNSNLKQTMIFIAHRLSSIRHCDQIFVLDKGKLVEQGTHEELLEKKGYYHELWQNQTNDVFKNYDKVDNTKGEEVSYE